MQMAIASYPGSLCLRLGCSGGKRGFVFSTVIRLLDVGKGPAQSCCI